MRISATRAWDASFEVAVTASPFATYACVDSWLTDFRDDLPKIDVPLRLVSVEGGPHTIRWTHHEEVNQALLEFLTV